MAETSGSLSIDKVERERLLKLYWLEKHLFGKVHEKFERDEPDEPIDDFDFYCIVYWKSSRNKTGIRNGLDKLDKTPGKLFDEVRKTEAAGKPKDTVKVLTKVEGIGIAIASAILAVCYPDKYTVVDSYVFKKVQDWGYLSDASLNDEGYLRYNDLCKRWSCELHISLRKLDRILWTNAWEEGLKKWLGE